MSRDVCMFDPMASCHHDCDECGPLSGDSYKPHVSQTGNVPVTGNILDTPPANGEETAPEPDQTSNGRYFESGAYRDADDDKWDYEGFLSPLVLEAFAAYMHKHRLQSDGQLRDSDNWQRGIPPEQYVKSAWRHFMDLWMEHRGHPSRDGIDEALGGLLFNIMGYWHVLLSERERADQ